MNHYYNSLKRNVFIALTLLSFCSLGYTYHRTLANAKHYFVCYAHQSMTREMSFSNYYKVHYQGCRLQSLPCRSPSKKNKLHTFGHFKTYPLALNAYYRCQDA